MCLRSAWEILLRISRGLSDYARSSGGWVYFGDRVEKMHEDGYKHQTVALAAHGLAALQPGHQRDECS
eukprot:7258408-Pyramimonas_sp.AAC.1